MTVAIHPASAGDMADLRAGLARLAADLGGTCRATVAGLTAACTGPDPAAHALIARDPGALAGLALISPVYSTFRGAAGVFVNDLWVAPGWRRAGLGQRLMAACAAHGTRAWGAVYLRLDLHDGNDRARAFYRRLGLAPARGETALFLDAAPFGALAAAA